MCIFKQEINLKPKRIFFDKDLLCVVSIWFFFYFFFIFCYCCYCCFSFKWRSFKNVKNAKNVYHVYNMRLLHRIFLIVTTIIPFDVLGALVFDLLQNFIVILVCWWPCSASSAMLKSFGSHGLDVELYLFCFFFFFFLLYVYKIYVRYIVV